MISIENDVITITDADGEQREVGIGTAEGFRILSKLWLRSGWDTKYVYSFSWLGRPIIQLPEDMIRLQEVIYRVQPDVIVETGIAHGGSLIYSASLCHSIGKGRVIGVDIEIRPQNRRAIAAHRLASYITMIEGSSTAADIVQQVREQIQSSDSVIVLLDSCHTRAHVLAELEAYSPFVTSGSYIVAMDGIMQDVIGAPRSSPDWTTNNPQTAVSDFLAAHPEFILEEPAPPFNEGLITERVTYWPNAFLKRL